MKLDTIDTQLLNFLQEDAKQTNKELSAKLDMSVTAVYERIKKLEKAGVIDKYVALVNKQSVGKAFVAFCHIKLVKHSQELVNQFEKEVATIDEVLEAYHLVLIVLLRPPRRFPHYAIHRISWNLPLQLKEHP